MNLRCHMCGQENLDPVKHRGLVINRCAYIRSQLLGLREQADRIRPLAASMRKGSEIARINLVSCERTIAQYEAELTLLAPLLP